MVWDLIWGTSSFYYSKIPENLKKLKEEESLPFGPTGSAYSLSTPPSSIMLLLDFDKTCHNQNVCNKRAMFPKTALIWLATLIESGVHSFC